jgi:hypothetical protein
MLDRLDKDRLTGPSKDGTTLQIARPRNTDLSLVSGACNTVSGHRSTNPPSDKKINSDKTERLERSGNSNITGGYICTRCGTLRSPEWRKGPHGPKTLCNACGCKSFLFRHSVSTAKTGSTLDKRINTKRTAYPLNTSRSFLDLLKLRSGVSKSTCTLSSYVELPCLTSITLRHGTHARFSQPQLRSQLLTGSINTNGWFFHHVLKALD